MNHETAIAWCNLPDDETILLLTPVLPSPQNNGTTNDKDPFEDLGKALASLHKGRIEHATYYPKHGLTDKLSDHMDETATVLTVIAEPHRLHGEVKQSFVEAQTRFAQAATDEYDRIHEGTEPSAMVLLYCGKDTFVPPNNIEMCWQIENYTGQDWRAVASKLLTGQES